MRAHCCHLTFPTDDEQSYIFIIFTIFISKDRVEHMRIHSRSEVLIVGLRATRETVGTGHFWGIETKVIKETSCCKILQNENHLKQPSQIWFLETNLTPTRLSVLYVVANSTKDAFNSLFPFELFLESWRYKIIQYLQENRQWLKEKKQNFLLKNYEL